MKLVKMKSGTKTKFCACSLTAVLLGIMTVSAFAATDYGNCEVTGQRGVVKLQTVTPNTLTVRPTIPAPGFWNGDSLQSMKDGFEYCLAANMAYRAGLDRVKLVSVSFQQLLTGTVKNFDIGLSEISITKEREKVVDFTVPYFMVNQGVLARSGTKVDSQSIKNLRIGAEQGTTMLKFIKEKIKPTKPLKVFNQPATMYQALATNQIDVAIYDLGNVLSMASQSGGKLEVVGQYLTKEPIGGLVNKGSPNLAAFNKLIDGLNQDGTIDKLIEKYLVPKWGGVSPSDIPVLNPDTN